MWGLQVERDNKMMISQFLVSGTRFDHVLPSKLLPTMDTFTWRYCNLR